MINGKIGDGLPLASIIYIYTYNIIQWALLLCGNPIFANGPKYMCKRLVLNTMVSGGCLTWTGKGINDKPEYLSHILQFTAKICRKRQVRKLYQAMLRQELINYKGTNTDGLRQKHGCFHHASPTWQQTSKNGDVTKQNLWWFCGSTAFRWSNAKFGPHFLLNKVIHLARVMPVIKTRRALCTFPCDKLGAPLVCLVSHQNDSKDAKMPNQGWHGYPIPWLSRKTNQKATSTMPFKKWAWNLTWNQPIATVKTSKTMGGPTYPKEFK